MLVGWWYGGGGVGGGDKGAGSIYFFSVLTLSLKELL